MTKIKTRALLYTKGPKVKKYQGGGVGNSFNSGYTDYTNKELYPNLNYQAGPAPVIGNPSTDYFKKAGDQLKKTDLSVKAPDPIAPKPVGYNLQQSAKNAIATPTIKTPDIATKPVPDLVQGGKNARGIKTGNAIEGAAPLVGAGGAALEGTTDGDDRTYTGKEKFGDVAGNTLKGVATGIGLAGTASALAGSVATGAAATAIGATAGSVVPIVGTIVGAVVGTIVGFLKSKKAKRKAAKAKKDYNIKIAGQLNAKNRRANAQRDSQLTQGPSLTSAAPAEVVGYNRDGGTFHWTLPKKEVELVTMTKIPATVKKFKRGGKVKDTENIIPNGVLHEEKNQLGDKGMPVVKCNNNSCSKQYEIERDEMILTLDTTKEIERLAKGKKFKELGEFVKKQVLQNTHSFTNKFVDLNNYKGANETIYT